jgi:hypothetical protein
MGEGIDIFVSAVSTVWVKTGALVSKAYAARSETSCRWEAQDFGSRFCRRIQKDLCVANPLNR